MRRSGALFAKALTVDSLNPNVLKTQYAVRGQVVILAEKLRQQLAQPNHGLPFNDIVFCNIGNPQQLGQKPISFFRDVQKQIVITHKF